MNQPIPRGGAAPLKEGDRIAPEWQDPGDDSFERFVITMASDEVAEAHHLPGGIFRSALRDRESTCDFLNKSLKRLGLPEVSEIPGLLRVALYRVGEMPTSGSIRRVRLRLRNNRSI